jgi:hypothetical protein
MKIENNGFRYFISAFLTENSQSQSNSAYMNGAWVLKQGP